jgi:hypothetical protein
LHQPMRQPTRATSGIGGTFSCGLTERQPHVQPMV